MAKILVIDDDRQLCMILHQMLTRSGHAVVVAHDGVEGINLFRADPADLVITDIVMPEQEGLGTIMALRRESPHLDIIAMSGGRHDSAHWLKVARMLGAHRTLAKPFTMSQLTAAIAEIFTPQLDPLDETS